VRQLASDGVEVVDDQRLRTLLDFALKVNADAKSITDADVDGLRACGLTDKGVVQLVHLVGDFAFPTTVSISRWIPTTITGMSGARRAERIASLTTHTIAPTPMHPDRQSWSPP
jgi:hypothetical protein